MTSHQTYRIQCPVCHNKSTVYHNAWATVTCLADDCDGLVVNPRPNRDNKLSPVEQAETDLHNASLTVARTKRILGDKPLPLSDTVKEN